MAGCLEFWQRPQILARPPTRVPAFVDSGADGTMLPEDILRAVGAEYEDTVRLRGAAGGVQQLDRYTVRIQIEHEIVHAVSAVATAPSMLPCSTRRSQRRVCRRCSPMWP